MESRNLGAIRTCCLRLATIPCLLSLLFLATGCFVEQSFPMDADELVHVSYSDPSSELNTRSWLRSTHGQIKDLLPFDSKRVLLTEDLATPAGKPIDVCRYFRRNPQLLNSIFFNFFGLQRSAQCGSRPFDSKEKSLHWPGFEDTCVPISNDHVLCGKLGLVKDGGRIRKTDCIIILSGIFGHNNSKRAQDIAEAILACGHHVFSCEPRSHGQTSVKEPELGFTFGTLESIDLLMVNDWLCSKSYVDRTGLLGSCWGGNIALLAAWYENHAINDADLSPRLKRELPQLPDRKRFEAGVMAVSPMLRFEHMMEALEQPRTLAEDPGVASVQEKMRKKMIEVGCPNPNGSARRLLEYELGKSKLNYDGVLEDSLRFLRFSVPDGEHAPNKLERARVPVLIVQASNDPLVSPQDVADVVGSVRNPAVAALVLFDGGHVGFTSFAPDYFYSLVSAFFDPQVGPAGTSSIHHWPQPVVASETK